MTDSASDTRDLATEAAFPLRLRDALPYIIYVFDLRTGNTIYQNRSWGRELGYTERQIASFDGKLLAHVLHPEDAPRLPELLARWETASDSEVLEVEYRMRRADGAWRTFHTRDAVYERDEAGKVTHIVGTTLDVTESRLLEEKLRQAQKLEVVGRLAASVAHDFNNILTGTLGYIELARQERHDPGAVGEYLDELERANQRAAGITRQLLSLARQRSLSREILDPREQIAELSKLLRQLLGERVELVLELAGDTPTVRIDRSELTQILVNFAVNARDAMPLGGKLLIGSARADSEGRLHGAGDFLLLYFHDTGEGMSEEVRSRAFEPFFTTKAPGRGTGLGLATVQTIVTQAGGHVSVFSQPGRGAHFKLVIPRAEGAVERAHEPSATAARPEGAGLVLVVDDEVAIGRLIEIALHRVGYRVLLASDAERAVQLAEAEPPVLLITDVGLPGGSGHEVAERLRERQPDLPVIYTSGYARSPDATPRAFADVEILEKPFTLGALLERVQSLTAKAR